MYRLILLSDGKCYKAPKGNIYEERLDTLQEARKEAAFNLKETRKSKPETIKTLIPGYCWQFSFPKSRLVAGGVMTIIEE